MEVFVLVVCIFVFNCLLGFCLFVFLVTFQLASQEAGIRDLAPVTSQAMTHRGTRAYLVSAVLSLSTGTAQGPSLDQLPSKTAGVSPWVKHLFGSLNKRGRGASACGRMSAQRGSVGRQPLAAPLHLLSRGSAGGPEGLLVQFQSLHCS